MSEAILVVEDSTTNRNILVHILKKLGYEVWEAQDGAQAFDTLSKPPTETPLVAVFSDIMMPQKDGLALLKQVREHESWKSLPFVLVTAVADKQYIFQAKSLNVQGYVLKPVTFQRVQVKLQEIFPDKLFPKIAG